MQKENNIIESLMSLIGWQMQPRFLESFKVQVVESWYSSMLSTRRDSLHKRRGENTSRSIRVSLSCCQTMIDSMWTICLLRWHILSWWSMALMQQNSTLDLVQTMETGSPKLKYSCSIGTFLCKIRHSDTSFSILVFQYWAIYLKIFITHSTCWMSSQESRHCRMLSSLWHQIWSSWVWQLCCWCLLCISLRLIPSSTSRTICMITE
mgnify:CR=1 FL=1